MSLNCRPRRVDTTRPIGDSDGAHLPRTNAGATRMTTTAVSQAKTGIEVTIEMAIKHGRLNVNKFVAREIWSLLAPKASKGKNHGEPALKLPDGMMMVFRKNGHAITLLAGRVAEPEERDANFHGDNDGPEEEAQP